MSYSNRVYRQRNAHTYDHEVNKPQTSFFNGSKESRGGEGGKPSFFQAKLSIGQSNDKYEQEADAVANKVVGQHNSNAPVTQKKEISSIQRYATPVEEEKFSTNDERMKHDKEIQEKPELQTKCAECEKEEKEKKAPVQMKAEGGGSMASPQLSSRIESTSGKGNKLPEKTLSEMNGSFGADFSNVSIHADSAAGQMNRELGAQAFTHGSDIYFNSGKYDPETKWGKELLAHELTHVIQQSGGAHPDVQRSCSDGACESCPGGLRDFWITFYFRRRATQQTMSYLRQQIDGAKATLKNCCLNLKAEFNWTLLGGGGTFNFMNQNQNGSWNYSGDATSLGTGNTFSGSKGIPVLVVDDVPASGGGVTVDSRFDATYTGRTYAVIGVNQPNPNPGCNHLAHELWHISSGMVGHDPAHGTLAACTGNNVSAEYCSGLRNIVAPVGDFPQPAKGTKTAVA